MILQISEAEGRFSVYLLNTWNTFVHLVPDLPR